MNILITGANGFLGQHLAIHLLKTKHTVFATGRGDCRIPANYSINYAPAELTDQSSVEKLVATVNPDIIIHTAAMSKPDECHEHKDKCLLHNVEATDHLLHALQKSNNPQAFFLFVSTDFVFGEDGPHKEEDKPDPLNFYGSSKWMAEQKVMESGLPYSIVRPVFIYGKVWPGLRSSFLHWVKNNLDSGKSIKVVADQWRTPTFVNDICLGIEHIIDQRKQGAFHLAGKDILSPYDMAIKTAQILGLDENLIIPVTAETFPEPVVRAKRSGLFIDKAIKELQYSAVSFEEGVRMSFLD